MLIKKDLLEAADEQYRPMLKEVSIPDFTKCIAQFSGLHISKVSDEVIKTYLLTWAKNKYRFYQLLGNKLKIDNKIQYKDENWCEHYSLINYETGKLALTGKTVSTVR